MAIRRYKMAASISATGNAQDTFTAQRAGTLKQVCWGVGFDCATDNGLLRTQVSRSAVGDIGTGSGTLTQAIAEYHQYSNFVTSGMAQPNGNHVVECNDKLVVGEQLFLNSSVSGTISAATTAILVIDEA